MTEHNNLEDKPLSLVKESSHLTTTNRFKINFFLNGHGQIQESYLTPNDRKTKQLHYFKLKNDSSVPKKLN